MDFSWTAEQQQLYDTIVKFAQNELNDDILARDKASAFNRAGWEKCARLGIQGLLIPEEYGGGGADILTTVCALEALGYGAKDNGLVFSINAHLWTCANPLVTFGSEEQKRLFLPKLCSGEFIGGNAMSEPASGSDAYSLTTTAVLEGDHYRLNGSKIFVTNAPVADVLVVYATLDPAKGSSAISAFLVEKNTPGLKLGTDIEKLGTRTSPMAELFLEDCLVPVENRLGKEGLGVAVFTHSMEWERGFILSNAVGAMQRQLEACIAYVRQRQQFGKSIAKYQQIATKIVEMKLRLETARNLLYRTAWRKGQGKNVLLEAAMVKLYLSESWVQSSLDAVQIFGGYGYTVEYEVERDLRDALGSRIYSGTSEIQRNIIAQFLGL